MEPNFRTGNIESIVLTILYRHNKLRTIDVTNSMSVLLSREVNKAEMHVCLTRLEVKGLVIKEGKFWFASPDAEEALTVKLNELKMIVHVIERRNTND